MELRQVIGNRRSMRFLDPDRPVEIEKVQRMLEAARLASFWGNVQALRAVVVMKDRAPAEVAEVLRAPVLGWQLRQAPVIIAWYMDLAALDEQSTRLHELVAARAMGTDEVEGHAYLDKTLIPFFERVIPAMKERPTLTAFDCGQGVAQATLMAFEQGLGTCLLGPENARRIKEHLKLPETAQIIVLQTVGYPAESANAGGQRPRKPFDCSFFLGDATTPFPRDPAVVRGLRDDGLIQEPAPLPGRDEEVKRIAATYSLPSF
jgi:nitroreductase